MAPTTPRTMFAAGPQVVMVWTLAGVVWMVVLLLIVDGIDSDAEVEGETLGLVRFVELVGKDIFIGVPRCDDC